MKTFPQLLRRQQSAPGPSHPELPHLEFAHTEFASRTGFDALDEKYEVLDVDGFWDGTAQMPSVQAAVAS